jgi:hypothetical protein
MRVDYGAADRKSDAHSAGLRRDEGFEQSIPHVRRNTRPRVADRHPHEPALYALGADHDLPTLGLGERVHAVAHQVQNDLLSLDLIDHDRRQARRQIEANGDAGLARPDQAQPARLADDLVEIGRGSLGFALADELAQATDDLTRPRSLFDRLSHRPDDPVGREAVERLDHPPRRLDVVHHGRQRLIELMRQRGRHFPHGAQARYVDELALHLCHPALRLVLLRNVPDDPNEHRLAVLQSLADGETHGEG